MIARTVTSAVSGLIFGLGLIVSGMTDPSKVQAFLDVAGRWDPSLAFVMVGAIAVAAIGFGVARVRPAPLLDTRAHLPTPTKIDARLVLGSALFGVGWGLGGFCPGPAIVALGVLTRGALAFVGAMIVGMRLVDAVDRRAARRGANERVAVAAGSVPAVHRS